jgi:hypothetical protein
MRRREIVAALSVVPALWASCARAQMNRPRILWLSTEAQPDSFIEGFREGLRDHGYASSLRQVSCASSICQSTAGARRCPCLGSAPLLTRGRADGIAETGDRHGAVPLYRRVFTSRRAFAPRGSRPPAPGAAQHKFIDHLTPSCSFGSRFRFVESAPRLLYRPDKRGGSPRRMPVSRSQH